MKIIGKAESGKFLVSASADEIAMLCGHHSAWYMEHDAHKKVEIGMEVSVDLLYTHLYKMRRAAEEVRRARGIIDTVASGLLSAETLIEKVMTDPESEKPQEGS